jgi:hypothetical protein
VRGQACPALPSPAIDFANIDRIGRYADVGAGALGTEGKAENKPQQQNLDTQEANDWPGAGGKKGEAGEATERAKTQHHAVEPARRQRAWRLKHGIEINGRHAR